MMTNFFKRSVATRQNGFIERPLGCFAFGSQRRHFILVSGLLVALSLWTIFSFATTTVQHEPDHISFDDTFRLMLTTDDVNTSDLPNLSPLQQDFQILGTEHNASYTMINGQSSSRSQWIILLRPKKTGKLIIPAIHIGKEITAPSLIEVSETPSSHAPINNASEHQDVMLKTSLSDSHPYVNQQILYNVSIYNKKPLMGAEYHPPIVKDALIVPVGNGRQYQTELHHETYLVEEQQYAIFPQKSGPFKIISPTFDATIEDHYPKPVHLSAKPSNIDVQPVPTNLSNTTWLPAKKVTLKETFDSENRRFKVGDTLTRTVTLQASAMPGQLLPKLNFETAPAFNAYPESPDIQNKIQSGELVGIATVKVTYLFNQAGKVTIPQLEIPWFNTVSGKPEVASLPTYTIEVSGNGNPMPVHVSPSGPSPSEVSQPTSKNSILVNPSYSWLMALGVGFLLGFLFILFILWLKNRSFLCQITARKRALKQIEAACKNSQPQQAHDALLVWAKMQWPHANIHHLQDIALHARDARLKQELNQLSRALYSMDKKSWNGETLWKSFYDFCRCHGSKSKTKTSNSDLPPINPV